MQDAHRLARLVQDFNFSQTRVATFSCIIPDEMSDGGGEQVFVDDEGEAGLAPHPRGHVCHYTPLRDVTEQLQHAVSVHAHFGGFVQTVQ